MASTQPDDPPDLGPPTKKRKLLPKLVDATTEEEEDDLEPQPAPAASALIVPKKITDLPREVQQRILGFCWEDESLKGPKIWTIDNRRPQANIRPHFRALVSSRELRANALYHFTNQSLFRARAENVVNLDLLIRPDLMQMIKFLELTSAVSAVGDGTGDENPLADHAYLLGGPGVHVTNMERLKKYSLFMEMGHVRMPRPTVGELIARRGGSGANFRFKTRITFRHYCTGPNLSGPNRGARYRFERQWVIIFKAHSRIVKIKRYLDLERLSLRRTYEPWKMLCARCFRHHDIVSDYAQRKICPDCHMAVYCSEACRLHDIQRHRLNECAFSIRSLDDFAGGPHGSQGHICESITTFWGPQGLKEYRA
ncbi:hypothetical protein H2200_010386 [Cladophialophora chaetospira]|uniref:MYND-type domain-containing protein n=1 Tax=Cladophialophora chaetospira TaxID=386627 RepID=A0AA38X1I6_9EURO|nr:hypothetical protein H2200_010386 [Cladophialophora chaetospira]